MDENRVVVLWWCCGNECWCSVVMVLFSSMDSGEDSLVFSLCVVLLVVV